MKRYIAGAIIGGVLGMPMAHAQDTIVRVSVLASGKVLLNGNPSDLTKIEAEFKMLQGRRAIVWYYRENAESEPTPGAMSVIELVVKYGLPISMSSKADFSDYVDENGHPKPRKP